MSELSALVEQAGALAGARVLVIGDVMLDRFVQGTVERISPEGPIPILKVGTESAMLGGAGNVARNLVALGAHAGFLSVVGDDDAGHSITKLFAGLEGAAPELLVDRGRMTPIKTRYLAGGQQLLRADREAVAPLSDACREKLLRRIEGMAAGAGAIVLSDYAKGVLDTIVIEAVMAAAAKVGIPVIVDPKGRDFGRYRGAALVTPNRGELAAASGLPVATDDDAAAAAAAIAADCGIAAVLATRGPDGMTLVHGAVEGDGAAVHLPARAREVFDVSGAGDTVVAVVAAGLAAGQDLGVAAALANAAAGIVVAKTGTATASAGELVAALHESDLRTGGEKVCTLAQAAERIAGWRRKDRRIGFTNGCFDLLHPGHISLVGQARSACDRLIVGLNSDASVKRLKGADRPVQAEAARAAVLASLANVDMVVIFGDDTPLALLETLRPDVLIKGADYTREEVVGGDLVESWGGRVVLAEIVDGFSTTSTISRATGGG